MRSLQPFGLNGRKGHREGGIVKRGVLSGLVACALVLAIAPVQAGIEEQKKACSPAQKAALDDALKASRAGLLKVIDSLKSNALADKNRFKKWFGGAGTAAEIQAVSKVYETALTLSSFSTYWCPNNSIPELVWDVGDLAAVHPSAPGAMFFTPAFFDRPTIGTDSQQGTIVHELSHRSGASLKPEVYQPGPAKNLALTKPADARKNGDNFQYYYEDLLFGVP
jgi:peptidyl-Lys metalloendopeptidase